MTQPLWGIDLGGTKIEGVVLPSLKEAIPIVRTRINTESHKGYRHILSQIQRLVGQMQQATGLYPQKIGLGTPGILDPGLNTMKNSNSTALNGMPLKNDLQNLLKVPVELANDANCFALAETHWGVVHERFPDARVVFGIIMGTGVGGGIVFDKKIWNGHHGIAGEWGHNYLDDSGGDCYCGKTGCVETVISGPGLERYYYAISGKKLSLKEIYGNYHKGTDENAVAVIDRLCRFFGKAVSVVTNLLDPDVIIIGGGVGNIENLYDAGTEFLSSYIFNNGVTVPVVKPSLGDSAGVFGAAALAAP